MRGGQRRRRRPRPGPQSRRHQTPVIRAQGGKNMRRKEKEPMDGEGSKTKTVCVTGAGGFIASWLVKRLLSTGEYTVHVTIRDLGDRKTGHLKALEDAGERLRLFKADGDVRDEDAWSDEDHCRTTGVAFSSLRPRIFVDECGLTGLLTPEQFLEEHKGMLQELFPSCAVLPGIPTTCWASVALGAGVGIGAAFPECSYIFNGSSPKWSGKA